MRKSVEEKGGKKADMEVIADADELRAKTMEVFKGLEEYKEKFIEETGGYIEGHEGDSHHIVGKTDYDGVGHYMMPEEEGGQGHGEQMRKLLNDYRDFVMNLMKENKATEATLEQFHNLTMDADEDPVYKEDPNQKGKKWSQLAFEYSPTHAGLATVSELQADILSFETKGLDWLQTRTGLSEIVFDEIKAMVNPVSKYVVSGNKYEAEMFIAASASAANPIMKYNGSPLQVNGGVGKVEFTANLNGGEDVGNGVKRKTFTAEITVPTAGGDTTFANTIEYFVVKPAIVVSSNSAVSLYRNCANEVRVDVPGLTGNYNPTFSGSGAQFIKAGGAGELNIVPASSSRKVVMKVSNAGQELGTKEFGIKEVPAPTIVAKLPNGQTCEPDQPIPTATRGLTINAIADSDFANGHEKDARFAVTQGEASLLSGGLVRQKIPFTNGRLNLSGIASRVRKGDILVIKIQRVIRRNFQGNNENFPKFTKTVTVTY
jgi:gliding motility-associated protein GldM